TNSSYYGQLVIGIHNGSSASVIIQNNTIANLNNDYRSNFYYTGSVRGIYSSTGVNNIIRGNIIHDLTTSNPCTGIADNASVIGISCTSNNSSYTNNISQNTIYNLANDTVGNFPINVYGIYFGGSSSPSNIISRNLLHSIYSNSTSTGANTYGIQLSDTAD